MSRRQFAMKLKTWHRPSWRVLAGVLVAIVAAALLLGLLREAPVRVVLDRLAGLGPLTLALAGAGWLASHALRALRLRHEWRARQVVPFRLCLRLVLLHNAALVLMPFRSGEAGYVWLVHQQWGVGLAAAARSLFWLRWQDAVVLLTFSVAAFLPLADALRWALAGGVLAAGVGVSALRRVRVDPVGWCCCLANWGVRLAVVAGLLASLSGPSPSPSLDLPGALRAALGGEVAAALPLQGPAGLGTYELGIRWGWLADAGTSASASANALAELVAVGFAVHLFCLAVSLVSAAVAQGLLAPPARVLGRA